MPTRQFAFSRRERSHDQPKRSESDKKPEEEAPKTWQEWLFRYFPHVCTHPFGKRHVALWEWFVALEKGVKPRPRIEVWPRGGAKSSTAELAVAYLAIKGTRRYCLYVSGTQEQADKHVAAIAARLEKAGVERSLNKYGHSKGWRRNQLRAAGFTVEGIGLDSAHRGAKIDEDRPDLIIFDDVDNEKDSPKTVQTKEATIKSGILPAGSSDCAVIFVQNMVHQNGVVYRLAKNTFREGDAYLLTREVPTIEPAAHGLTYESYDGGEGVRLWRVTGGEATWEGQDLAVIESQINEWSLNAFLREAQHEVELADGYFFNASQLGTALALPEDLTGWKFVLSSDFAATQGAGDYTAIRLWGKSKAGIYYIVKSWRGQWSSDHADAALDEAILWSQLVVHQFVLRLKQGPGDAGKKVADQMRKKYAHLRPVIETDTGAKAVRCKKLQAEVNVGNVRMVDDGWVPDLPEVHARHWRYAEETGEWNWHTREEYRQFREDEKHPNDDQADADADAINEFDKRRTMGAA